MKTWEVSADQERYGWSVITPDGNTLPMWGARRDAVEWASRTAREHAEKDHEDTAVNVHDSDGFIVQAILYFTRGA